jgi:uncharacterized membrane protein YfcA
VLSIRSLVLGIIALLTTVFLAGWWRSGQRHAARRAPTLDEVLIGFVTNFFDALGIGSFPTSTSIFRLRKMVPEEDIPGTLNVGHAPAAIVEAMIFLVAIAVDPVLLIAMNIGTAVGAWLGAGVVIRLPRLGLQLVLGLGTLVAAVLFVAVNLHLLPGGGDAFSLSGIPFVVAVGSSVVLGSLMAAGVGLFGPCMIILALLGMHPLAAFPIMMSAGALQQLVSGIRYLRSDHYAFGTAVGLGVGGFFGALIAALLVKSLPVGVLRWLVAAVALYVAADFLMAATRSWRERRPTS